MFPIASRREHAPILSQVRVAWELDEADTSLFWTLGIPSVPQPSVLVPCAQEIANWEPQDDTWVGRRRQGKNVVAGPLPGSFCFQPTDC